MMFKNQLIYSVTFVLALFVSACMALPINITSIGESFYLYKHMFNLLNIKKKNMKKTKEKNRQNGI